MIHTRQQVEVRTNIYGQNGQEYLSQELIQRPQREEKPVCCRALAVVTGQTHREVTYQIHRATTATERSTRRKFSVTKLVALIYWHIDVKIPHKNGYERDEKAIVTTAAIAAQATVPIKLLGPRVFKNT